MEVDKRFKLTNNIYRVAWWDMDAEVNCDVYAIDTLEQVVLIDSGRGGSSFVKMRANLEYWGLWKRVSLCLITHMHRDHAGGITELQKAGISVWGQDGYLQYVKDENAKTYWKGNIPSLDRVLSDQTVFKIGSVEFNVIKTPGHTSTDTTYIAKIDSKYYAFTGDLIMPNGKIGYSGSFDFDSKTLMKSLERLLTFEIDAVLTGHYLETTQPEGFWLNCGKAPIIATLENGKNGKWFK